MSPLTKIPERIAMVVTGLPLGGRTDIKDPLNTLTKLTQEVDQIATAQVPETRTVDDNATDMVLGVDNMVLNIDGVDHRVAGVVNAVASVDDDVKPIDDKGAAIDTNTSYSDADRTECQHLGQETTGRDGSGGL